MARLRAGSEEAVRELYRRYAAAVYTLALRMLSSKEEAEEVLQDAFYKLYREAHRFDAARGSVKSFLYAVARSLALSRLRTRAARPRWAAEYDLENLALPLSTLPPDHLTRVYVREALDTLAPLERELLEAAFFEGCSHAELSARYELPLGTLKSKLRRALLKLRERLEEA